MGSIILEELGKKHIDDKPTGCVQIVLYKDHFEVLTTEDIGIDTTYIVCATVLDYLENVADDLDKVNQIMLKY
jgi:hypothetical protein